LLDTTTSYNHFAPPKISAVCVPDVIYPLSYLDTMLCDAWCDGDHLVIL